MKQVLAVAGILQREGTFLIAERPAGKIMAGYWEFPGGKPEEGETLPQALERELVEELGITVTAAEHWRTVSHRYAHGQVTLHVFFVSSFTGEPAPLEGQALRWVTPSEALSLKLLPVDFPLVRDIAALG